MRIDFYPRREHSWVAVGVGAVTLAAGVVKSVNANKQKKKLLGLQSEQQAQQDKLDAERRQGLSLAENLYNGRMGGASALENGIYENQANTIESVNRAATDSSQALAVAGAVQGNTNNALGKLSEAESADRMNRAALVANVRDNVVNAETGESINAMNQKAAIYGVAFKNQQDAISDMANGVTTAGAGLASKYLGGENGSDMYSFVKKKPWYANQKADTQSAYGGVKPSIYANAYPG